MSELKHRIQRYAALAACSVVLFGASASCTTLDIVQTTLLGVLTGTTIFLARNV